MADLQLIHNYIASNLAALASTLPPEYKLTLVARHVGMADADIIVSEDDLSAVLVSIERLVGCEGKGGAE